tara:strand:- start:114 stop:878 length:765 start_codon:yes stop_codon:yes gene_type:complete
MKPLVTVITPVFNGEAYIKETIDSVLNQSFLDFEYIIIDDCSTDTTPEILEKYAMLDSRISVIRNVINSGPLVSRNNAIDISKADYVAFIDADDVWVSHKLERQIAFMKKSSCAFSYTDFAIFTGSKIESLKSVKCVDAYYLATLFSESGIALSSVVFKRDSDNLIRFANTGPYTEGDLYLKLIAIYGCGLRLPEELLKYRQHNSSMSKNKIQMFNTIFHFYNQKLKFNRVVSFMITFGIGFRSLSRQIKKYFL